MAKTGRTLDMVDLTGKTARRRRRARINSWLGRVVCAAIAVTTAVFAVVGALSLATDQGRQEAYDKAPYCADTTTQTQAQPQPQPQPQNCVRRANSSVVDVYASKNTGKNAHGYTTKAYLDPHGGKGQTVVLSSSQDLTFSVTEGDLIPVLVWHDQITRFTYAGRTHDADQNPHHIVAVDLSEVALCLVAATIFGRPLIRRSMRYRIEINLQRNRIPDWTLVFLAVATPIAALLRASYVVVTFGLAGVAVLVLSVAWPFIPWVATPSPSARPYLSGQRNTAAVKKRKPLPPSRLP